MNKKIVMHFHCAGVVSDEKVEVINETEDTVTINDSGIERRFSKKTGKCLNDNTAFGAKRTIDIQPHMVKPDLDNLWKAVVDALRKDDSKIYHCASMGKYWTNGEGYIFTCFALYKA